MPRALITGVTGQDGWYLSELLREKGYELVGLVRPGSDSPLPAGVAPVAGDLADAAALRAAVLDTAPDELYHLAAPTFVPGSWRDPAGTLALVAGATAELLLAVRDAGPGVRMLAAGSGEVFGAAGRSPQDEDTPMRPRSPYGVAKVAAFGMVDSLRREHRLHASSAIAYNHESPRRSVRFVSRKVSRAAAAIRLGLQDEIELGDLDAVRDWCHARDVVRGYWLMLQQEEPGDYVLAGGVGRTVRELVETAFACVGLDPAEHVRVSAELVRPPEPVPPVGDITRARRRLGWEPRTGFREMIEEMVRADLADLGGGGAARAR